MREIKTYVILAAATVFLIFSRGMIPFDAPVYSDWDLHNYRLVAHAAPHLSREVSAPFAYRILGPYIAGLLPIPDPLAFRILTSIACLVLVILLYKFLMDEGIERYLAAIAALLFACNRYFFGLMVWDPFQIDDVLAMLCIVACLMLLARKRWISFALCFAIGCLTREVVMVLIPVSFAYLWERGTLKRDLGRWLAAVTPAIVLFTLVRTFVYADGAQMSVTGILPYYVMKFGETVHTSFTPIAWFRRLVWCFMPFALLPLVLFRATVLFFSRYKYMLLYFVLIVITDFWGVDEGGGDAERLMAPSFLAFYWLVAFIVQTKLSRPRWVPLALLAAGYLSSLHHLQGVYPLPNKAATLFVTIAALVAVTGIGLWVPMMSARKETLSTP